MNTNFSVCGIDCSKCSYSINKNCAGCRIVAPEGKCVWGGRCELHDCAVDQHLQHCGNCSKFPCQKLIEAHKNENPNGNGIEIDNLRSLITATE